MKTLSILTLLMLLSSLTFAQFSSTPTGKKKQSDSRFQPASSSNNNSYDDPILFIPCTNIAAVDLVYQLKKRYSKDEGLLEITGVVKNFDTDYQSGMGKQAIVLYESRLGRFVEVARKPFTHLSAKSTISVSFTRPWNNRQLNKPTYRVCVVYAPDNDNFLQDCQEEDNCYQDNGVEIMQLFR